KFDGKANEGFLVGYSEPESEVHVSPSSSAKTKKHDDKTKREAKGKSPVELSTGITNLSEEFEDFSNNNINEVNAASTPVPAVGQNSTNSTNTFSAAGPSNMPALEDITYSDDEEDVGAEADFSNLETTINVTTQTRSMTRMVKDQDGLTQINNKDFYTCMFSCFLSQEEPKRVHQALKDPSWIEAMQKELLQFKMQKEEGINYEEVLALVARIEAIRLFLAYASFMGFMVYQMDVKSAFLYGTIEEEVYVCQPPGFEDPDYPDKVYKVVKALYGLHQALRAWYETLANYLLENGFQRGKIDQTLFIKKQKGDILLVQKQDEIFISQDKYVAKILRKFGLTDGKSASTPIDTKKPLLKDPDGEDVDVHTHRSMIGSLMYLTSSRPGIMFAVCACAHFHVTPKASHLHAVKRIFRRKVIITEDIVRQALRLGDAESIDCLITVEIFAELERMSLVRNVDSSSKFYMYPRFLQLMIAAQVGDLSSHTTKYTSPALTKKVFANMRRVGKGFSGVDTPLFEGMLVPHQVNDVVTDDVADVTTDDVADEVAEDAAEPTPPSLTPAITPPPPPQDLPSTSQIAQALEITKLKQRVRKLKKKRKLKVSGLKRLSKIGTAQRVESSADTVMDDQEDASKQGKIDELDADEDVTLEEVAAVSKGAEVAKKDADAQGRLEEFQAQVYHIDLEHADKVLSMQDDEPEPFELKEVIEVVTTAKLITEVVTAAATTIIATPITAAPSAARRRKGVVIRDPEETATPSTIVHSEPKSNDKGKDILVEEPKPLKKQAQIEQDDEAYEKQDNTVLRYQALKRKPQTEAHARKNMMVYLKNMASFKMDFFKGMSYDDIRAIFEKNFNYIVGFLEKGEEQLEEAASKALKRKSKSSEQQAAKKQKLDEEVEELKTHLQIVLNDEDDVYTEATPLALKVPVVDYQIHTENNKPHYKIIRANGTHQLFLSFISLLRNFDREDLEMLWQIVQARFASLKPKNFSDDFLLTTLKAMFEKPDVEAHIWKNEKSSYGLAKVKS
nr:hypothetical protein [Tanacetum cinerariifolium]